tara:strand:- start:1390 stop:3882 length:2493 start_codon:yes stop_codon:yes gene_type:complete
MAVVSRAIPTLLRGVSQAADSTKQADHADIQDNADSDPVLGLAKRSGTQFVSNLISGETTIGSPHITTINRDVTERYVVIFTTNNVRVFELDGTEKTVNKPDGVSYLSCTTPRSQIKTITIADFTFVVNTSITAAMDSTLSAGSGTQAIVFFNQVTDNTTYSVTVDGVTVNKDTSSDNPLSTATVAAAIKSGLDSGLTGFTIARNGPVLHIKKNDNSNFSIDSTDTQGNTHITTVKNTVQQFSDLPTVAPNGMVVEVKGDESTNFDNYYVKFVTNNGGTFEEGQWEESVEAGITFKFNYDTMPHVLIRQTDGNFRFARVDGDTYTLTIDGSATNFELPKWGERTVGDEESAPNPSFIGSKINNVFFFRNRLGFLADDNVVLSRVSEFFNFFPETVLTVIDSDPIDVAASHTKVAILKNAVNMGEKLILFSDQTQFNLTSSSDSLTPKTANVIVTTEFESTDSAPPVGSGSSIYYLTKKGDFAGVREYISQEGIEVRDASNITIHIPRLIPNDIYKVAVSTNEDVLVLLGATNPNILYVNRWLYGSRSEKILNSWFTYTFDDGRAIKNIDFIGTELFIVTEKIVSSGNTEVDLEKIPFASDFKEPNATFEYHLDRKVTEATSGVSIAYNSSTKISTITLPYKLTANMEFFGRYLASGETSTFVDTSGATQTLKPGQNLFATNTTDGTTSTVTINNADVRNSKFIIGEPYEMHYRFSSQRLTESSGGQKSGEIISGRLQLKHFYIKFEDTGFFKVEVTPDNNTTSTHLFTGRLLGASSATIGQINLETGTFKVPIMSRADRVTIDVKNDSFLPTILSSAEYEAMFHMRSRRI